MSSRRRSVRSACFSQVCVTQADLTRNTRQEHPSPGISFYGVIGGGPVTGNTSHGIGYPLLSQTISWNLPFPNL
ncbi:Hypothetical protein NTJ_10940 [Nesidiocoris tenuis]|uniref:Peptidase S1 domain-containing protein n=1 Tax=Nesidiocoris tenuis TaxID=355587 RepID=A0ABN7B131_9HEMI|nr:Hypothetical protein NTJ_10940 [Nesidiocoris tenuis]